MDDPRSTPAPPASSGVRNYLQLFKIRPYILVVLGYVAQTFALGAFGVWGPTFLYRVHGLSLESAAKFFGAALAGTGLIATFVGGFAATAWHKRNPAAYGWVLGLSVLVAVPCCFAAFLLPNVQSAEIMLAISMFFLFLPTGPTNTLILETVPTTMRASAMAASIFAIHLLGDLFSPSIVGALSDRIGLQKAVLILPVVLLVATGFWLTLAVTTQTAARRAIT